MILFLKIFANNDCTNSLLTLGQCLADACPAVKRYSVNLTTRNLSKAKTFRSVEQSCQETDKVKPNQTGKVKPNRIILVDLGY